MVRAKFKVVSVTRHADSTGAATIRLEPRYDENIPEDQRFAQATPTGHIEMWVNNLPAIEQLGLGDLFYVDFTLVK